MNRSVWRNLVCCALAMGFVVTGSVQAQGAAAAAALPDFTGIVKENAPAVVHVEAKYNGKHASAMQMQGPGSGPQGRGSNDPQWILRHFFGMPMMPSPEEQAHT